MTEQEYLFGKNSILKAGISSPNYRKDAAIALVLEFAAIGSEGLAIEESNLYEPLRATRTRGEISAHKNFLESII